MPAITTDPGIESRIQRMAQAEIDFPRSVAIFLKTSTVCMFRSISRRENLYKYHDSDGHPRRNLCFLFVYLPVRIPLTETAPCHRRCFKYILRRQQILFILSTGERKFVLTTGKSACIRPQLVHSVCMNIGQPKKRIFPASFSLSNSPNTSSIGVFPSR